MLNNRLKTTVAIVRYLVGCDSLKAVATSFVCYLNDQLLAQSIKTIDIKYFQIFVEITFSYQYCQIIIVYKFLNL